MSTKRKERDTEKIRIVVTTSKDLLPHQRHNNQNRLKLKENIRKGGRGGIFCPAASGAAFGSTYVSNI
jgi:hypothetical protein